MVVSCNANILNGGITIAAFSSCITDICESYTVPRLLFLPNVIWLIVVKRTHLP